MTHFGRRSDEIFAEAIRMGASTVRVGFEDSDYINETVRVKTNAELVRHTARLIRSLGCDVMTPARDPFSSEVIRKRCRCFTAKM